MNETLRNSISALVDQEASEFEARKVLNASKSRSEVFGYWAKFHAVGSAMRGEQLVDGSLLDRINATLDGQAATAPISDSSGVKSGPHLSFSSTEERASAKSISLVGQFGIAASIALAVIVGVAVVTPGDSQPRFTASEPVEVIKFQLPAQKETVAVEGTAAVEDVIDRQPTVRILSERDIKRLVGNRLSPYLIRHAENSAVVGGTSLLPLARIMGRDTPIE